MKCSIVMDTKHPKNTIIVQRKFVPIRFNIIRENQFVNANVKLPFSSSAVVGMLTTNRVDSCKDTPPASRLFFGTTHFKMTDTRFLDITPGQEYTTAYPPDARIDQISNNVMYWYYAHPAVDRSPYLFEDDFIAQLGDPMKVEVQYPGQCDPTPYHVWSARLNGFATITYNPKT